MSEEVIRPEEVIRLGDQSAVTSVARLAEAMIDLERIAAAIERQTSQLERMEKTLGEIAIGLGLPPQ